MMPNKLNEDSDSKVTTSKHTNNWLTSIIFKLPVLGEIIRIANTYVYDGDLASDKRIAPFWCWVKKLWGNLFIAIILSAFSSPYLFCITGLHQYIELSYLINQAVHPGNLITSIFPSILGFGIGVYALIFGLSSIIVKDLHRGLSSNGGQQMGSVLMLNADMAYPLLVVTLSLIVGVFQQVYSNFLPLESLTWFVLWYSMLMVIEILTALFALGENELLNKLNK